MFERNKTDSLEQGAISVEITLADGQMVLGKVIIPASRGVIDALNGPSSFLEFEPFDGERTYIAKASLKAVRLLNIPRAANLGQRVRDLDGFDPYTVLGLQRGATWDEIRAAYHRLAKLYHPDRYATAELPEEVVAYLAAMARRVNAAYASLETTFSDKKQFAALRQQPIYTSPLRG